jgi:hypothetical protein
MKREPPFGLSNEGRTLFSSKAFQSDARTWVPVTLTHAATPMNQYEPNAGISFLPKEYRKRGTKIKDRHKEKMYAKGSLAYQELKW